MWSIGSLYISSLSISLCLPSPSLKFSYLAFNFFINIITMLGTSEKKFLILSGECINILSKSLFVVGEIGGNDYNYPFFVGRSLAEVQTFVSSVIQTISSAIHVSAYQSFFFFFVLLSIETGFILFRFTTELLIWLLGIDWTWSKDANSSWKLPDWLRSRISFNISKLIEQSLWSAYWMHQVVEQVRGVP